MSGIAGVAMKAGVASAETPAPMLARLLATLAHRGGANLPSSGCPSAILREAMGTGRGASWADAHCALGVQFTPRTPEDAHERQPLCDPASGCVLVWDGRLDNRDELAAALEIPQASWPDSALVLGAFLKWGEACAARLLGDFAFAVWDPRQQSLYAARDPMGVRPFFYYAAKGAIAFASEVQALLHLPGVSSEPDEVMAGEALLWWSAFPCIERTFYRDVRRLPPAHSLRWDARGLRIERYWDIDPSRQLRYRRREEYLDQYVDLLRRAVACRLRANRPVGVFLSGGMDSSAVASVAGGLAPAAGTRGFHLQLAGDPSDESAMAELVARQAGMPLHSVPLRAENVLDELGAYIRMQRVPLADLAFPNDLALLHLAAREGCGALFTGDGSDEVFAFAWAYVADLIRSGRWLRLARILSPYARYYGRAPLYLLKNSLRYAVPRPLLRLWKRGKWCRAPVWIEPEFAKRSGLLERLRDTPQPRGFRSVSAREDYVSLTRGHRVLLDESRELEASRLGVEYRFPFYDTRMLEFMFAVPWEEKVDGWQVKPFLRQAPGLLPEALQRAGRKANYLAYGERLWQSQRWGSLRPLFDSPPRGVEQYIHLAAARRIAQEFLEGGHRLQRETFLALAVFLLWRSSET